MSEHINPIKQKSRRLLILLPSSEKGGAEIATFEITRLLKLKGWDIYTGFENTVGLESFVNEYSLSKLNYIKCNVAEKLGQIRACLATLFIIKKIKPDIIKIVLPWPSFGFGIRFICALFNLPTVVVFQYVPSLPNVYIHPLKIQLYKWMLSRRQNLITVSVNNKELLCQSFSISQDKVKCIYNGINVPEVNLTQKKLDRLDIEREFNLSSQHKIMLTVANFYPNKGYEDLLKVVPLISHEFPNTIFLWAGNLFAQKDYFENKIEINNLQKNLRLLGFRSDIPKLLNAADFFIFPSLSEGFSLSLLEAMASHLPIIASNNESNVEILRNKTNALMFNVGNYNDLYLAIYWSLMNSQQMQNYAQQARNDVQAFSNLQCAEQYDLILSRLLSSNH